MNFIWLIDNAQVRMRLWYAIFIPRHKLVMRCYVFPTCIRMAVHPSDSNLRGANIIEHVCSTESLLSLSSRVTLFDGKHVMLRIQLLLSMTALLVWTELLCSSICKLPLNRANRVAVFEGSPIRYNTDCLWVLQIWAQDYNHSSS